MDPIRNPYSPGAGSPPPELVGRDPLLNQARILLARVQSKRAEKSLLLTGLRGVGKTVLLNEIERIARDENYLTLSIEAHDQKSLGSLIVPPLRNLLFELDRVAGAKDKVRKAFGVLRGFMKALKIKVNDIGLSLDVETVAGVADSGDLENDLQNLLIVIGEAAEQRRRCIAIFIDEMQYLSTNELSALIMSMHRLQQRLLPIVLLGAGLPILPALAGESKSYAERLFNFPEIGPLSASDAAKALRGPAKQAGVLFERDALNEVFELTQGYPYFVQEWGYMAWNTANSNPITLKTIREATKKVTPRLDANFFRVRFDRLTPSEKQMLRSMATLGPGPYRMGDIANAMKVKVTSLGPRRKQLIQKGMIFSPAYGELAFTVPLFDEFLKRVMPHP